MGSVLSYSIKYPENLLSTTMRNYGRKLLQSQLQS